MKDEYEVGLILKEHLEAVKTELKPKLSPARLPPLYSDSDFKQALLNITPEGYKTMLSNLEKRGIPRAESVSIIAEFMEGRQF